MARIISYDELTKIPVRKPVAWIAPENVGEIGLKLMKAWITTIALEDAAIHAANDDVIARVIGNDILEVIGAKTKKSKLSLVDDMNRLYLHMQNGHGFEMYNGAKLLEEGISFQFSNDAFIMMLMSWGGE